MYSKHKREVQDSPKLEAELESEMQGEDLGNCEARAKKFQMGKNPMEKTPFEHKMCDEEKKERYDHRRDYILGIQGRDGGPMPRDKKYGGK